MGIIMNASEQVAKLVRDIESAVANLKLHEISAGQEACVNVQAEEDCVNRYGDGKSFTTELQTHVSKASSYIQQIGETFEQADQQSVRNTYNGNP